MANPAQLANSSLNAVLLTTESAACLMYSHPTAHSTWPWQTRSSAKRRDLESSLVCSVQDAVNGAHEDVQKLLQKRGGRVFKALNANASAVGEMAEGDRRHAITEILHFASTGNIMRMQVLCKAHGIKVDSPTAHHSSVNLRHHWNASRVLGNSTWWSSHLEYVAISAYSLHMMTLVLTVFWHMQVSDPTCCDYDKRTPL